jgi:hypothetical protein
MDTKQLRIRLRMLEAALDHAALLAELGREASEGTPHFFLFDAVRKAIRDFRHSHPAIGALWHQTLAKDTVQGREAELHNRENTVLPPADPGATFMKDTWLPPRRKP